MSWTEFYKDKKRTYGWPSELVISFICGSTFPDVLKDPSRRSALEVGFGNGNNLRFLSTLGFQLSGTEVGESICEDTKKRFAEDGIRADLKIGKNSALPFAANQFDLLLSWNVIHYEQGSEELKRAVSEYHRVMRAKGRFLISTTAPGSPILEGAETTHDGAVIIRRQDDFRQGEKFRCFQSEDEIREFFSPYFDVILIGRTTTKFGPYGQDSYLVSGVRK